MIKHMALASRYARAFIEYCSGGIGAEAGLEDLKKVRLLLAGNHELTEAFVNPEITCSDKCGMVDQIFADGFSVEIRYFLKTLIENKRFGFFAEIAECARMKYAYEGKGEALIKTFRKSSPGSSNFMSSWIAVFWAAFRSSSAIPSSTGLCASA
jgi:F0F1-type ATP synthase delta subunit